MKFVRPLLLTLAGLALLGAAGLAVALTPSFQRWAVLRVATKQPGLKLELASISAGFSQLQMQGLRLEQSGVSVQVARIDADYALWPLLFQSRIEISQLKIADLLVDASQLAPSTAGAATVAGPTAAPGVLAQIELPVALVLGDCQVAGRLLLPGARGQPAIPVSFNVTGGKFAPGQEGVLVVAATVTNPDTTAPVTQLNANLRLRAMQTEQRTFSQIGLVAVVDAEGKSIAGQNQLKITTQLAHQESGESYTVSIDTLTNGAAEKLLALQATLANGDDAYTGKWALNARTAQIQAYLLGGALLPEFAAQGQGQFSLAPATSEIDCQGDLRIDVSKLETIEPAWRAIGSVNIQSQFDVAITEQLVKLRKLAVAVAGESPVLELRSAPAVEINLVDRRLQVGGAATGDVLTLKLLGLPMAWVRPFVQTMDVSGGKITGEWIVSTAPDHLRLRSQQPLRLESVSVVEQGRLLLGRADIVADYEADVTAKEIQVVLNRFTLKTPDADTLSVQAKLAFPLKVNPTIAASLNYQADLPKLLAPWVAIGHLKINGSTEFALTGDEFALQNLNTTINDGVGTLLLKLASLQPFTANLATKAVTAGAKGPADLVKINVGQFSLATLPLAEPGAKLEGVLEKSEFMLSMAADKLLVRSLQPLKVAGVAFSKADQSIISGLSLELSPRIEVGPQSVLRVQSGDFSIRTKNGATLATVKAEADRTEAAGWRANATFSLEIPQLVSLPVFQGAQAVSAGRASGEVRMALNQTSQVEARLTINGLVDRTSGQTLPVANLSFQGVVLSNGKISIKAPLLLDNAGRRSDLNVSIDLNPAGPDFELIGKVTGEHLELTDLMAMLGVFSAPAKAPEKVVPNKAKIVADTVPVWSHFTGQLGVDVKSIGFGNAWAMTGLNGAVTIAPTQVSLGKLEAQFGEKGRLAAHGHIVFAGGPQPYQLAGKFSVTEFETGKLFKALDPTKPATVEGSFTVDAEFAGRGETLERMGERSHGQFTLTSRQGVFRGLQRTTNKLSKTTKAVELGASVLGSLFGQDNITKAAEKVAGTAYFVDQLAQELGELKYDQLSVRLTRDVALNLNLEDISLVSPDIRLIGQGTVTFVENKPLLEQPLTASLALAARGKTEELLGKMRLLSGVRDELGYAKIKEVLTVNGTLTKPDPTAFFTKLATAKLTDFLGGE